MGPSNISFLSFRVTFHFYDCGRKGILGRFPDLTTIFDEVDCDQKLPRHTISAIDTIHPRQPEEESTGFPGIWTTFRIGRYHHEKKSR